MRHTFYQGGAPPFRERADSCDSSSIKVADRYVVSGLFEMPQGRPKSPLVSLDSI